MRQFENGIDCGAGDPERHPGVGHQKERRKTIEDAGALRALGEAPTLCKRHEDIFDDEIVAAGAEKASRLPGVENPARCGGKQHDANFRLPIGTQPRVAALEDDTPPDDRS